MQEAWQQCCTAGYGVEEVNEVVSTFADGECSRMEEFFLPIAAMSKTSTTKYALAILPTEIGGFGYYKNDDDNDNDMEDNGEGGNKSGLFQVLPHNKHSWFLTIFGTVMSIPTSMTPLQTQKWLTRTPQTLPLRILQDLSLLYPLAT